MWKSVLRRTLLEWVKPQTRETGKRPSASRNFIPCIQVEASKSSVLFGTSNQHNNEEKEKEKRHTCHEQSTNHFRLYADSFLETFGWVGTAVMLSLHLRHFCWKSHLSSKHKDHVPGSVHPNPLPCGPLCDLISSFTFSPLVFNMRSSKQILTNNYLKSPDTVQEEVKEQEAFQEHTTDNDEKEEVPGDITKVCEEMVGVTVEYFGEMENFVGVNEKNEQKAFVHFRKSARLGCAKAHFNLGVCYETGHGTAVNFKKAAEHYKLASQAGHSLATYNLGIYYLEGKGGLSADEKTGLDMITKAAKQGVHQAQTHMGVHFLEQQDWLKGLSYLKQARNEDPEATYYLAMCYKNGWGVKKNLKHASELYQEAASAGNTDALQVLNHHSEKVKSDEDRSSKHGFGIHAYSSVPELYTPKEDKTRTLDIRKEISMYLDVVFPNAWKKSASKVNFWLESSEENQNLENESSLHNQVILPNVDVVAAM